MTNYWRVFLSRKVGTSLSRRADPILSSVEERNPAPKGWLKAYEKWDVYHL
jgi:hypothetical protein